MGAEQEGLQGASRTSGHTRSGREGVLRPTGGDRQPSVGLGGWKPGYSDLSLASCLDTSRGGYSGPETPGRLPLLGGAGARLHPAAEPGRALGVSMSVASKFADLGQVRRC